MRPHPLLDPASVLRGHGGDVQALAFSPARPGLLYSGDSDGELRVWDLEDRRALCACRLHQPEGGILGLALLNATTLATQGRDGQVKVWALTQEGGLAGVSGPPPPVVRAVGAAPAASPAPPTPLRTLHADSHSFCPLDVCMPEGWALREADGCGDGAPPPSSTTTTTTTTPLSAQALALVAGRDGASAVIWDLEAGVPLVRLVAPAPPDRKQAAGSGGGGAGGRGMVMAACFCRPPLAAFSAAPLHAVTSHEDGTLVLWRLPDEGCPPTLTAPLASLPAHGDAGMALALLPDGSAGVAGGADDLLAAFAVSPDGAGLVRRGTVRLPGQGVGAVAVRGGGASPLAAATGWDGHTCLVRLGSCGPSASPPSPLAELAYHAAPGASAAFSPDGAWLATGGRDGAIALWGVGEL